MIIIFNCGSSSIKIKLYQKSELILEDSFKRMGHGDEYLSAVKTIASKIKQKNWLDQIKIVAHRVVHGGDFASPYEIKTKSDLVNIEAFNHLAPLHNPPALAVLKLTQKLFPLSRQLMVFDTSFFLKLPDIVKLIPISKIISDKFRIRKYGFHGISHEYMARQIDAENKLKIITLHLGAGSSITATSSGRPLDTSMSFTPLDGLIMQSRSGSLDPGVVIYLTKKIGLKKTEQLLNLESGLAGLTGTDGDMRNLLFRAGWSLTDKTFEIKSLEPPTELQTKLAQQAIDKYCQEIGKMIAAYDYVLSGADKVVFSGQIGYGSKFIRDKIMSRQPIRNIEVITMKPDEELAILKQLPED